MRLGLLSSRGRCSRPSRSPPRPPRVSKPSARSGMPTSRGWDGYRVLVTKREKAVRFEGLNRRDCGDLFASLRLAVAALAPTRFMAEGFVCVARSARVDSQGDGCCHREGQASARCQNRRTKCDAIRHEPGRLFGLRLHRAGRKRRAAASVRSGLDAECRRALVANLDVRGVGDQRCAP